MISASTDYAQLAAAVLGSATAPSGALAALREAGFGEADGAWQRLRTLLGRKQIDTVYPGLAARLLEALITSFDPHRALNNLLRFAAALGDTDHLFALLHENAELPHALAVIFSGSQYLSDILVSDPRLFDWLTQEEALYQSRFKDEMHAALSDLFVNAASSQERLARLRHFKKRELLRIGLRDLVHQAELAETLEDLSNLADVCVQKALDSVHRDLVGRHGHPMCREQDSETAAAAPCEVPCEFPCEFLVLGLGKLGGRELNFSSDIDLVYVYTSEKGSTTGIPGPEGQPLHRLSNHEFFSKLAQRLTSALNDITSDGYVFRVDLNLRPEGVNGDVVNSLRSCEIYYESWGQTWERQAMLKARAVAGSRELGRQFTAMMRPFIYRRHLDFGALAEIREMKQRIDDQVARSAGGRRDVKLGRGGIREIEFIVQAFQLIYGGRDGWLRERNTLRSLHRLAGKELLTYDAYARLTRAYIFLRDLENRLQIMHGRQTHTIPEGPEELRALAATMGCDDAEDASAELLRTYERHTAAVREVFSELLRQPTSDEEPATSCELTLQPDDVEHDLDILRANGFGAAWPVLRNLVTLRDGQPYSHPSASSRRAFMRLLPEVIRCAAETPEPALAIANLLRFVESYSVRDSLYALFEEENHSFQTLIQLCGASRFLAASLVRYPDVIHGLVDARAIALAGDREALRAETIKLLAAGTDHDEVLDDLRRFKQSEELRIGIRAVHGDLDEITTGRALSTLADAFLDAVLELERYRLHAELGRPRLAPQEAARDAAFCIVAVGKLGGGELSFGSDLDLFFVYEADGLIQGGIGAEEQTNQQFFAKLAARIIHSVSSFGRSGVAYRLDARLRPDGQSGILANSLSGLESYFASRAQTWERQAMTKARIVAGEAPFGGRVLQAIQRFVYASPFTAETVRSIDAMRQRLERELGGGEQGWRSLKFARGSLLSIEFLVQALQIKEGKERPALRAPGTTAALEALAEAGVLPQSSMRTLQEAFRFYKRLELRLRIMDDRPQSLLPGDEEQLEVLARALAGFDAVEGDAAGLLAHYRALLQRVAQVYDAAMRDLRLTVSA